ncbi:hypothetical protein OKW38_001370 [Paraburkholderia sp. MM5496-R1]|uniref:hypothetical protein n=1 Tax=Paraburkholderia sp. MM5496-R1 TaxID=2991065 RepID=UPI003D1FA178
MSQAAFRDSARLRGRKNAKTVVAGLNACSRRHARVARQHRVVNDFSMQLRVVHACGQQLPRDLMMNRTPVRLRKRSIDGLPYQIVCKVEFRGRRLSQDPATLEFHHGRQDARKRTVE